MTAQFIAPEDVVWKPVNIIKTGEDYEYRFELPVPLADWDVFDYWERERLASMKEHLANGMTLYDVGTEQGWCNLIYATFVGPDHMVLIEPTRLFWPNIRWTWERNYGGRMPTCYYDGLFSSETDDARIDFGMGWPYIHPNDDKLIDRNSYEYIHQHSDGVRQMRLDDFVARSSTIPDAITIDVEGGELSVLKGAEETLRMAHPLVWVSVHPDLMERDYGVSDQDLHDYMTGLGYTGTHLATDHEQHWFYQ